MRVKIFRSKKKRFEEPQEIQVCHTFPDNTLIESDCGKPDCDTEPKPIEIARIRFTEGCEVIKPKKKEKKWVRSACNPC